MIKKVFVSGVFVIIFGFYVWNQKLNPNGLPLPSDVNPIKPITRITSDLLTDAGNKSDGDIQSVTPSSTPTPAPIPVSAQNSAPTPKPAGLYKDGTFIGSLEDAYYGYVQVETVIKNDKIQNIVFLAHPDSQPTSVAINNYAMPLLKQEAIQAQSAKVNGVTGASATSYGFKRSLTFALSQAKI